MFKKKVMFLFLLVFAITFNAVSLEIPYFKKNDRVAVIGDSITHGGTYHLFIDTFLLTRFPQSNITFYNKGILSDTSWGTVKRLKTDILPVKPTVATIMLGMNDIYRSSWIKEKDGDKRWVAIRKAKLDAYRKSMAELVQKLKKSGVKRIILLTPSIYDQTSTIKTKNYYSNRGLAKCRKIVLDLAKKEKLKVAKIFNTMIHVNKREQKKDPTFSIVGAGRIHPGQDGHLVMAYAFMKSLDFPCLVSRVDISYKKKKIEKASNCKVANRSFNPEKIEFDLLEKALPFPHTASLEKSFSFVPFDKDFNQEILKISDLPKGNYKLKIDNVDVGTYNSKAFSKGINLAKNSKTPMNKQALKVYYALAKRRASVARYDRHYAYMRYVAPIYNKDLPKNFDGENAEIDHLNKFIQNSKQGADKIRASCALEYLEKKDEFDSNCNSLLAKAQKLSKPVKHHFVVEFIK